MRHFSLAALCAAALAAPLATQLSPISLDASVGGKGGARRAAVRAWYPVVQAAGRLHLGLGARVSAYGGDPIDYPNRGTVQGSLASNVPIDPVVYALNSAVFGELDLTNPVALGANLDVIGVATGPTRTAGSLSEKPQGFSYFRYGSGDHRALNSEVFVSLRVAPRVRVRGGARHYVTTHTVTDTAAGGAPSSRHQKVQNVAFHARRLPLLCGGRC